MSEIAHRMHEVGEQIRARRKFLKLTQVQLAQLADVSPAFVFELEDGRPTVSMNRVLSVCEVLGLEIELKVRQVD